MNIQLPGRKATIAGGVVATLLVFIGQGMFEGTILIVVLGIVLVLAIIYTAANVIQKVLLPTEMNPPDSEDDVGDLLVQMDNVRAGLAAVEKKADMALAKPPVAGAKPK